MSRPANYDDFIGYRSRRAALGRERSARERAQLRRFGIHSVDDLIPVDAAIALATERAHGRDALAREASASISHTYIHPDPDRRALIDAWLSERG